MAKVQIRDATGYKTKTIDKDQLEKYMKDGWGEVIIGKPIEVEVIDYVKGKPVKVKQKQDQVKVRYAVSADVKAKDAEIEALKKQLAEANK